MYKRILVPLDGSKLAEQVVPYAAFLANGLGAEVHLLRAFDPLPADLSDPEHGLYVDSLLAMERGAAQDYLETVAAPLREAGIAVASEVAESSPAERIVERAEEDPSALVAMSTHGRSGLGRWLLGSVTDKVLRATRNPLLIVRPTAPEVPDEARDDPVVRLLQGLERVRGVARPEGALTEVIVALDGSPLAESALPHATAIAAALGLKVILARAAPTEADYYRFAGFPFGLSGPRVDVPDAATAATDYLKMVGEHLRAEGVAAVEERVLHGEAATAILDLASATSGSMVAMTTHGRSGVERWVLGSVADRIVRHADVPVLVVRPGDGEE